MKSLFSRIILIFLDGLMIGISLYIAYCLKNSLGEYQSVYLTQAVTEHIEFLTIYIVILIVFAYEGIYTNRYDFWHESYLILKGLILGLILVFAYFALTKSIGEYSRFILVIAFIIMSLLIPLSKFIFKKQLFHMGLWKQNAKIYGPIDLFLKDEVFANHYLGYVQNDQDEAKTIFINSKHLSKQTLAEIIEKEIGQHHEVIFVPLMNEYDFSNSDIYLLTNARTNLFVIQNRLMSQFRRFVKRTIDIILFFISLPLLLPLFGLIVFLIRKEEPNGSILFVQERLGSEGKIFLCYKFRTMYEQSEDKLKLYLEHHPEEVRYYKTYHKYQNDPRITNIGKFLRKTSLDELPQIFNVIKNEMSFVGPRPYMLNECNKMGASQETILNVKPGISGLWQVSGRSDIDFIKRLELDCWYVRNWSIWLDIIIILKTIKVVLLRKGAS